jgi:alkylhydroperoxidase/carboxymuconolactone decarboxylase family protein YurZ
LTNSSVASAILHDMHITFKIGYPITNCGDKMVTETPLKIYEKLDPDLLKHIENSRDFVFADGALPRKFKLLIAMAFDASYGAVNGVKSLAQQALEVGATKEEIAEALRVAQYLSGVGCVYTAAQGLKDLLE